MSNQKLINDLWSARQRGRIMGFLEEKFDRHKKPNGIQLHYEIETRDEKGNLEYYRKKKAKSWTKWLIVEMQAQALNVGATVTDNLNIGRGLTAGIYQLVANAASGVDAYGIQVGSNATAPVIGDVQLNTKIVNGVGANQLQYGACSIGAVITAAPNVSYNIGRAFTNSSGSGITVRETGISFHVDNGYNVLNIRDTPTAFTINNGSTSTVTYTITTTI